VNVEHVRWLDYAPPTPTHLRFKRAWRVVEAGMFLFAFAWILLMISVFVASLWVHFT
jgi:hypothetical protein